MEKIFADGLIYKAPRDNAPEFVKGAISIKVDEFKAFLDTHSNNGWVNLDFLKSQKGGLYFALNDWKPEQTQQTQQTTQPAQTDHRAMMEEGKKNVGEELPTVNVDDIPMSSDEIFPEKGIGNGTIGEQPPF